MIKVNIREKYRGLSDQKLLDKAYELGFNFEKYSGGCSQSTVAALHELIEMDDVAVRLASSSSGGQSGQIVGTCGSLIGGTMVLDYFFGRPVDKMSHEEGVSGNVDLHMDTIKITNLLYNKYIEEYGTILCPHIQVQLFGRHFYVQDEDDMEKLLKAGGHSHPKKSCSHIVGNAARWTMEILIGK